MLVAELGSFSGAGRCLDLAPSSVARVVDRIEARLGVRLLLRTTRSLTLTPEGVTYLSSVRRILADIRDTERSIADQGSPRGRLRVSASSLYGRMFVVPHLGAFIERYPDIVVEMSSTDRVVDIAAGQADVAVRVGPLPDGPLTARKLGETCKVIVAAPEYLARRGTPVIPQDLHDHLCIGLSFKRAAPVWPFRENGRLYSLPIRSGAGTDNGETQGQLAARGVGIARVCIETVEEEIEDGRLVPLLQEYNPGDVEQVHAVFVGGARTPARVRCFVEFLAGRIRRETMSTV